MTIIAAVKTYIQTYIGSSAPMWVDYLGPAPIGYSITPLPGVRVLEKYLNGGSMRQYAFAFQSMNSTADELERIETSGFYEAFADWLDSQTEAGALPTLGTKQLATLIEANGWAYLYEQGQSDTGIYQVNCRIEYEQLP